ncbi:hypothetical protein C2845_PM13G08850 [Panicum miliaceum]|uniref:TRF2/HOY1 PH-like domain-containing protein n=1 Tax=Panicum miliaceum TaxID=4540 RepID=A0A3L6RGR6_PANMI|nr:hypothetical protein C2845_PM13G08850 [Panicum miliaceum]
MWHMFSVPWLPAKRPHDLFPLPNSLHLALPCLIKALHEAKIDQLEKIKQDSFLGLGLRIRAEEWRKRPEKAWSHVGNIDENEEVVDVSWLPNMLQPASPNLQEHNKSADMASELLGSESSPLGLTLNKDNLLKMIQEEFAKDGRGEGRETTADASIGVTNIRSSVTTTSLKPSKFHAYTLRIGTWQWISRYDVDLIAKFYYGNSKLNSKLVWEILDEEGLKRKIEIDSMNISDLKLTCPEGQLGDLEIMLSRRPRFSREANQQPRKSTTSLETTDFTGGQASIHRRHVLQCAPGILNKHIAKLLSKSQAADNSNTQDLYHRYGYERFGGHKFGEQVPMPVGTNIVGRNHNGFQNVMSILKSSSAGGQSSMVTGAPSGGLQQHGNMFNSYDYQQFGGQESRELVSMSTGTNAVGANQNGSQDGMPKLTSCSGVPSGDVEQHKNMFNWSDTSSQTLHQAQQIFFSGTISGGLQQNRNMFNSSSSLQTPPRQAQFNIPHSNLLTSMGHPDTTAQTFRQQVSPATSDAMVLERISHDLLDDIDMEPTGAAEEAMACLRSMSVVVVVVVRTPVTSSFETLIYGTCA